jgi:hypothetical protein
MDSGSNKWLGMDLKRLLFPKKDFDDNKIEKSKKEGITRIDIRM